MMEIYPYDPDSLQAMRAEAAAVLAAIREAGRDAVLNHLRLGLPLVTCDNGQVTLIPAEQLQVDPPTMQ
jgi:hypothetical protein